MVSWLAAVVMMLSQGNATDVLDLVDAASYWKAQNVQMTADALAAEVKPPAAAANRAAAVRRLMAIRALGELKDKAALPLLKPLLGEQAPFVADYARQAIATIEGAPYRRQMPSAENLAADVALLPSGCSLVAQTSMAGGAPISYDALADILKAATPPGGKAQDVERVRSEVTQALTQFTGTVGNFRIESVTMGVAGEFGPRAGFLVVIARGLYDADAAREAAQAVAKKEVEEVEDVGVIRPDSEVALAFPSNDRAILVAGPARESVDAALVQVLAALKTGKGGLDGDAGMKALLASVDRAKHLWAAAAMTDTYRQAELFAPFDTITLTADEAGGTMDFLLVARGRDADAAAKAVGQFEAGRQDALKQMKANMPAEAKAMMGGIVEMIEGVKTAQDGAQVTVTASLKGGGLGGMLLPLFGFSTVRVSTQPQTEAEQTGRAAQAAP